MESDLAQTLMMNQQADEKRKKVWFVVCMDRMTISITHNTTKKRLADAKVQLLATAPSLDVRDVGRMPHDANASDRRSDEARAAAQLLEQRLYNAVSLPLADNVDDELLINEGLCDDDDDDDDGDDAGDVVRDEEIVNVDKN
jgi:hypothetical protein